MRVMGKWRMDGWNEVRLVKYCAAGLGCFEAIFGSFEMSKFLKSQCKLQCPNICMCCRSHLSEVLGWNERRWTCAEDSLLHFMSFGKSHPRRARILSQLCWASN